MPVSFTELLEALELVSTDRHADNQAYVCRQSGKVYSRMDPTSGILISARRW